ncbi:hypothetical protein CJF30_00007963 [Rutstroemia sp. NJR-2017a BBW]|nr:hypothetical protein CJF30_00007963 [Rutstroemia sp. NJR-2017a BBW]
MHFSKLFMTAMVGAASAAPAIIQQREMTSDNVVGAINDITVLSGDVKVTVQGIDFSPLAVLNPSTFTPVVTGFKGIITLVQEDLEAIATNP